MKSNEGADLKCLFGLDGTEKLLLWSSQMKPK